MSFWSRFANVFCGERLSREIEEEMESHFEEALSRGRDAAEARRSFGPSLRQHEASRDIRIIPWLDALRADAVFGWRQLHKRKVESAVAILSLGLAFGACTSAFRLIDALLLRPLPIKNAERLYVLRYEGIGFDGRPAAGEMCEYPLLQQMVAVLKDQAELVAISPANPRDLTYGAVEDLERPYFQYVSGRMFDSFGIRPALGRLFTANDDRKPLAHPYAVLSYDYWTRRFGRDPKVIGRSFHFVKWGEEQRTADSLSGGTPFSSNDLFTIIGVAGKGFTGVEPGTMTDVFVPITMNPLVVTDAFWFRTFAILRPGVGAERVREELRAVFHAYREDRAKAFSGMPQQAVANYVNQRVLLEAAAPGVSAVQREFRKPLAVLGVLVALVLLLACANVANLMTAQAAARAREMALRVSIGAGRARLVQLVLVEAAALALLAALTGGVFAWWSAPFVASHINFRDRPLRLHLPADWRVLGFGLALMLAGTLLFGLAPALRASAVKPASALRGGDRPYFRGRLMQALVAAQATFCFLVLFSSGLFVATFERLSRQPIGFSPEQLLALDVLLPRPEPPEIWRQVIEDLRTVPGVANAGLSATAPLGNGPTSWGYVSLNGGPRSPERVLSVGVAPGWFGVMKIPLIAGRDFRSSDANDKFAIVNEAFANRFFPGESPVGKVFGYGGPTQIIGVARNARHHDVRGPFPPVAYLPFRPERSATFMVRTANADPLALASTLSKEAARARPGIRVSSVVTEDELLQAQTVRERLLATLALFFASLALLLAALGLYGVLDYSVLQRRREIGIRMAIGARAADIARQVAAGALAMVLAGAAIGLALSLAWARYVQTLLYEVKPTDPRMIAIPLLVLIPATLLAAIPAAVRAIRTDPVASLRAE
jgi:predicted permease